MSFDHESEWPSLKALAERGESAAMVAAISKTRNDGERISLYRFIIRKLSFGAWENKSLDVMTAVADAAIADCELIGGDYLEQANVICFNTSANLADCWADDFAREGRHFGKGLEYARKAFWYREHLGKGPGPKSMATWAIGKHEQSLGMHAEALADYRRSLEFAGAAARDLGKPVEVTEATTDGYLIAAGYVALMEGDQATLRRLGEVLQGMHAAGGEGRDDADIIALQLNETAKHMGLQDVKFGQFGSRS